MSRPDLVVHVGLAASVTLLSSALSVLAAELSGAGVRICAPSDAIQVGGTPVLVVPPPPPPVPADPSDAWAFCSLGAEAVAGLVAAAGARRARIVFCPERQDRLLERTYRAAVTGGFAGSFADLFPRAVEPLLDHTVVASAMSAVPGVADVRVMPTDLVDSSSLVGAVVDSLDLIEPVQPRALAGWREPRELDGRGTRIAAAMAAHLDSDDERARVRDYLLANFSAPAAAPPSILTDAGREQMLAAYRPLNRAFLQRWAPGGTAPGGDATGWA